MNTEAKLRDLSVSECVDLVRTTLQSVVGDLTVRGEITDYRKRSGDALVFFDLKDKDSSLTCFMLGHEVKQALADGMEVRVIGYPSLFKKSAKFHLRVHSVEAVGEGALRKQLELTKKKLEQEGLFAPERKRNLPLYPEHIGVITSEDAAAFTDVKRVLQNRWPLAELVLVPSAVQGTGAIASLIRAFEIMEQHVKPDVIILARGGGSLEDLQAFNSEELAHRMFACAIPIVSGVGHERDVTIADLVADVRASTPSNAVELAVPDRQEMVFRVDALADSQMDSIRRMQENYRNTMLTSIASMTARISSYVQQCRGFFLSIGHAGSRLIENVRAKSSAVESESDSLQLMLAGLLRSAMERLQFVSQLMAGLSPKGILKRGFSITRRSDGSLVRSRSEVGKHDILTTTVSDGDITSEVS